jgi:hypothetical protein
MCANFSRSTPIRSTGCSSQAIVHGLTIVTPDPLVTQYPARTLWGRA